MSRSSWNPPNRDLFRRGTAAKWGAGLAVFCTLALFSHSCLLISQQTSEQQSEAAESIPSGIAWYGILADGIAEAKATNRPIMLLSAAPQCAGVPGMW